MTGDFSHHQLILFSIEHIAFDLGDGLGLSRFCRCRMAHPGKYKPKSQYKYHRPSLLPRLSLQIPMTLVKSQEPCPEGTSHRNLGVGRDAKTRETRNGD